MLKNAIDVGVFYTCNESTIVKIRTVNYEGYWSEYDLCDRCAESFFNWKKEVNNNVISEEM